MGATITPKLRERLTLIHCSCYCSQIFSFGSAFHSCARRANDDGRPATDNAKALARWRCAPHSTYGNK